MLNKNEKFRGNRLYSIDGLRFIAALAVVLFHYLNYGAGENLTTIISTSQHSWITKISQYGFVGVELFFMISGFVILYSAQNKSWQQFAKSRFVRIYPTLWLAATITFIGLLLLGATSKTPTFLQYLANLTLMHRFVFNQAHLDGVYWTLTTELRFYVIIGVMLAFGWLTERKLKTVMALWSLLAVICLALGKSGNFITYGAYFAAGVSFYYLWAHGKTTKNILFVAYTLLACLFSITKIHNDPQLSKVTLWFIVLGFFAMFYMIGNGYDLPLPSKVLTYLGGMTYPLYLLHQQLGYSLLQYVDQTAKTYVMMSLLLTAVMMALSFVIYRVFEPWAHQTVGGLWDRTFEKTAKFKSN